jgi:predicted nucleotidyltransferase
MISEEDRLTILKYAEKYRIERIILFGSSLNRMDANDIDIGVKGLAPELFFEFCWEVYRDLSKPVDIVDLDMDCLFTKLIEEDGLVLYG